MTLHKVGFEERESPLEAKRWIEWGYQSEYYFDDEACTVVRTDYRVYPKITRLMSGTRSKILDLAVEVNELDERTILQIRDKLRILLSNESLPKRAQEAIRNILKYPI